MKSFVNRRRFLHCRRHHSGARCAHHRRRLPPALAPETQAAAPQATPVPVATNRRERTRLGMSFPAPRAVERVDVRSRVAGAVKSIHSPRARW